MTAFFDSTGETLSPLRLSISRFAGFFQSMIEDDFDLASLATFLHLTPDQVRKMAERDKIPGRKVAGDWKFSKAEIHQWFEERIGLSDERGLSEVEKVLEQQTVHQQLEDWTMEQLLSVDRVFVPLPARTKSSVLESICRLTADSGVLWEPDKMTEALRRREALHPTALENGVALLHPRRPMPNIMGQPFLSLGMTPSGIPFGGPRGTLTDVFFLIGSNSEPFHLRLLARISRLLQAADFLTTLRETRSAEEAWDVVINFDQKL
jgi:PTS system nitrogen regulatory IIA component